MADEKELKIALVKQMLRKRYFGRRYADARQIIPKIDQADRPQAKKLLQSMANAPTIPVGHYKDKSNTYQLVSKPKGEQFIEQLGGDPEIDSEYDDIRIVDR